MTPLEVLRDLCASTFTETWTKDVSFKRFKACCFLDTSTKMEPFRKTLTLVTVPAQDSMPFFTAKQLNLFKAADPSSAAEITKNLGHVLELSQSSSDSLSGLALLPEVC
jgi:hypothetical protein